MADGPMTLLLCGDVMTGRGVDQVLPCPGDPHLRESYADDARAYVRLAERAHSPIPRPGFSWPWGDALHLLDDAAPDARVINLETSVTRSAEFASCKPVHYRMSPENLPCVTVARPDVCALANNHVLDFGRTGLQDTLDALARAGVQAVGAGRDVAGARQPVAVPVPGGSRAVVFSCGAASSGIPPGWAATASICTEAALAVVDSYDWPRPDTTSGGEGPVIDAAILAAAGRLRDAMDALDELDDSA